MNLRRPWIPVIGLAGAVIAIAGTLGFYHMPQADGAAADRPISTLQDLSDAYVEVAEATSHAVVYIEVSREVETPPMMRRGPGGFPFPRFFDPRGPGMGPQGPGGPREAPSDPRAVGRGSGFILSPDGYIVTNHHVAGEADRIQVTLEDGRNFDATLVGSDPQTEIALIKIDAEGLPTVTLGDSDNVKAGEWILAIGSPFGLDHSVSAGIVSAHGRSEVAIVDYANFIQTDAAINPGNSGGPLINLRGEVIGMNTAILSRSGGNNGIGFAIPINMVAHIVDDIRDDGKVVRGYLGVSIQSLDAELSEWFNVESDQGVLIGDVVEDSPADRAGLQKDDIVLRFNGQPVKDALALRSRVATTTPETEVPLSILRDGREMELRVTLGRLESGDVMAGGPVGPGGAPAHLGMRLQNLDEDIADQLGYAGKRGVVVAEVQPGSPAHRAGIEPGMLITEANRQPVASLEAFRQALEQSQKNTVLLNVHHDGRSRYVALKLARE